MSDALFRTEMCGATEPLGVGLCVPSDVPAEGLVDCR